MGNLREFLGKLDGAGLLTSIKEETDLRYVEALIRKEMHENGKAIFFENLKGYDMRLCSNITSSERMSVLALGVNNLDEAREESSRRIKNKIEPIIVKDGPVKEVIMKGDEVDLTKLPIPLQHENDGAPYISGSVDINRNPDDGELNLGVYRHMFRTKNTMCIDLVSASRSSVFFRKVFEEGKPLDWAVGLGGHPTDIMAGTAAENDFDVMGSLRNEPLQLVKCETVDLMVPNDFEIILEGQLLPLNWDKPGTPYRGWAVPEGPYGEAHGFMSYRGMNPLFKVTAITHRKNPIYYEYTFGSRKFRNEQDGWISRIRARGGVIDLLKRNRIDARDAYTPSMFHVIVSIKKWFEGDGKNAIALLFGRGGGVLKKVVVVDEDVNVRDLHEVEWATATRVEPSSDIIIISGMRAKPYDPSLYPNAPPVTVAKYGVDATKPLASHPSRYRLSKIPFAAEVGLDE